MKLAVLVPLAAAQSPDARGSNTEIMMSHTLDTFHTLQQQTMTEWCEVSQMYRTKTDPECLQDINMRNTNIKELNVEIDTLIGVKNKAESNENTARQKKEQNAQLYTQTATEMDEAAQSCQKDKTRLNSEVLHFSEMQNRLTEAHATVTTMLNKRNDDDQLRKDEATAKGAMAFVQQLAKSKGMAVAPGPSPKPVLKLIAQLKEDAKTNADKSQLELEKVSNGCDQMLTTNTVKRNTAKMMRETQKTNEAEFLQEKNHANLELIEAKENVEAETSALEKLTEFCRISKENYDHETGSFTDKDQALRLIFGILSSPGNEKDAQKVADTLPKFPIACGPAPSGSEGSGLPDFFLQMNSKTSSIVQSFRKLAAIKSPNSNQYASFLQQAEAAKAPAVFKQLYELIKTMVARLEEEASDAQKNDNSCEEGLQKSETERDHSLTDAKDAAVSALAELSTIHKEHENHIKLEREKQETQDEHNKMTDERNADHDIYSSTRTTNFDVQKAGASALDVMEKMVHKANSANDDFNFKNRNSAAQSRADSAGAGGPYAVGIEMLNKLISEMKHIIKVADADEAAKLSAFNKLDIQMTNMIMMLTQQSAEANSEVVEATSAQTAALLALGDNKDGAFGRLVGALDSFQKFSAKCSNNQMTWEEALAARQQEIDSLKGAKNSICKDLGDSENILGCKEI